MKCIKCGAEIQPEFKICPYCGTTIQIVPDYSVYDEDNINVIVENVKETAKKVKDAIKDAVKKADTEVIEGKDSKWKMTKNHK